MIKEKTHIKVKELLETGKTFALVRLPDHAPRLIHDPRGKFDFFITPWRTKFANSVQLFKDNNDRGDIDLPTSTEKEIYIERVGELIKQLARRGMSKTVISRVISGQNSNLDIISAADELWTSFPATLGFLFYTPSCGLWLGATPEKLLFTFPPHHFSTMALAGTLPIDEPWNVKNYEEHELVSDFMASVFRTQDVPYMQAGPKDLVYGNIKHLCTSFSGDFPFGNSQAEKVLDALSPTPALSGFPRAMAFDDIEKIEDHERRCYGGYITIKDKDQDHSWCFVVIRCAQIDLSTGQWVAYAGGGITPKSNPEAEWVETEEKSKKLVEILSEN